MLLDDTVKRFSIEHTEHLTLIGHLHGRSPFVCIASNDILSQALGGNHKLLAQLAGTQ